MKFKLIFSIISFLVLILGWIYFPYTLFYNFSSLEVELKRQTEKINVIESLDLYLKESESQFTNLRPGLEKKIEWYDNQKKNKTDYSLIFMPGFTATRKEIWPVVEILAKDFGANAFYSRLPAHGEEADDYARPSSLDFFTATQEAVAVGRRIGRCPIFIGASTGASLLHYVLSKDLGEVSKKDALVTFSPAYYEDYHIMNVALSPLIGPKIIQMVMGDYYDWKGYYPNQAEYWNTRYNTKILPHLVRVFKIVSDSSYLNFRKPHLLMYNKDDKTINYKSMIKRWHPSNNTANASISLNSRDHHVIAGDITSPENTQVAVQTIKDFLANITDRSCSTDSN